MEHKELTLPTGSQIQFRFSPKLKKFCLILMSLGLLSILLQLAFPWHAPSLESVAGEAHHVEHAKPYHRLYLSLLLSLLFVLPICLGGVFFVGLQHLSGAEWSISLRRLPEQFFWYLPFLFLLMSVIFFGAGDVYHHWVGAPKTDKLLLWKSGWLNLPFFISRNFIWVALWSFFGWLFLKHSLKQDQTGDVTLSRKLSRLSAGFIVVFGITYSLNSWDLSMSLEPHWFSTLWAIYIFAGLALSLYSFLVICVWYLKRNGYYGDSFNENHLHNLGKFMFGHTIFWTYMALSQFVLIWYAAIPEETIFFKVRNAGNWYYVSFSLVMMRFVFPFFLLLKREKKRSFNYLAIVAVFILIGQVWDMYWISYPTLAEGQFVLLSWQELGSLAFVIGSFIFVIASRLEKVSLIPLKDPRMEACLHYHQ